MKNDKTGLGGRMNDFEFVVVKKEEPKGKGGPEGKKPQDKQ